MLMIMMTIIININNDDHNNDDDGNNHNHTINNDNHNDTPQFVVKKTLANPGFWPNQRGEVYNDLAKSQILRKTKEGGLQRTRVYYYYY